MPVKRIESLQISLEKKMVYVNGILWHVFLKNWDFIYKHGIYGIIIVFLEGGSALLHHPQLAPRKQYDIRIWQCTDFERHWHGDTEIYICLQGQMKICIEGKLYCLNRDDTVFVASNEAHEIFCDVPDTLVVLIAFGYALLGDDYCNLQDISVDRPFFNLQEKISQELLDPLLWVRNELCKPGRDTFLADWQYRSSLYAIAAYICRHKQANPASRERLLRTRQLKKMHTTLQYIAEHFQSPISVEQAAAVSGYDKSYFCKQFRKTTGMTFHRYLNYYRLSAACTLLEDVKLSMSAVAEQSGFSSQKNLSRLFQQVLGMTPSQYRKLPQEAKSSVKPL